MLNTVKRRGKESENTALLARPPGSRPGARADEMTVAPRVTSGSAAAPSKTPAGAFAENGSRSSQGCSPRAVPGRTASPRHGQLT